MRQQVKCVVAIIMTVAMLVSLFPLEVFAQNSQRAADATQTLTTSVDYDSAERATATVTYHKVGEAAPACNIVFLLDASRQGGEATDAFKKILGNGLLSGINAKMQVISYTDSAILQGKEGDTVAINSQGLNSLLGGVSTGEGTANPERALEKATEVLGTIDNNNPTVVFWVLSDGFGSSSDAEVESALEKFSYQLNRNDALIAWQLADEPNNLIAEYATRYTSAERKAETAAYAESDEAAFRSGMRDSLERVLHDHYRDASVTLSLQGTVAKAITKAEWDAGDTNTLPEVTTEIADDGKSVTVNFDKLCAQISGDLVLTLALDTDVNKKEIVLAASTVAGAYYSGLFDEEEAEKNLSFPDVEIDRQKYTITFEQGEASGTPPATIASIAGEYVTLPDEGSLTNSGSSFGGWNVKDSNTFYSAGQIIAMPANDLTLTPAWGHVEVELELGDVRYAEANGNQMSPNAKAAAGKLLNFVGVQVGDGETVANESIHSVQVVDDAVTYNTTPAQEDLNKIEITDPELKDTVLYARHVGATDDDYVVAYLKQCDCSGAQEGEYDLIIAGPGGVVAPADMSAWISGWDDAWTVYVEYMDVSELDTSQVTNMNNMFWACGSLTTLDLSNFDTRNVTTSTQMLSRTGLTEIPFGENCTFENTTNMVGMFGNNGSLKKLDLSSIKTKNVTTMSSMFQSCPYLEEIIFGDNFSTANVTTMANMFLGAARLTSLDVSGFDTSKVTNMWQMFRDCNVVPSLDLSNFDTSNVTNMNNMFAYCRGLEKLDLSSFDTSNVEDMTAMFYGCHVLKELTFSDKFDTTKVTNMLGMFGNCKSLTSLTLPACFNTTNVTNMSGMFCWNYALKELDLSQANFDTSKVTDLSRMFQNDTALETVKLGDGFNVKSATSLSNMFSGCSVLTTIDGKIVFSTNQDNPVTTMERMFYNCRSLSDVPFAYEMADADDAQAVSFSALKNMAEMFRNCSALEDIDLGGWVLPDLTNINDMFYGCTVLDNLDLSWTGIKAQEGDGLTITNMFTSVPANATLTVIKEGNGNLSDFMQAVKAEFKSGGRTVTEKDISPDTGSGDNTASGDATNALPPTEPEPSPTPQPEKPSDGSTNDNTSDESTSDDPTKNDATTGGDASSSTAPGGETMTDDPEQDATEPAADAVSPLSLSRSGSTPVVQADDGEKNYTVNGNIWTHNKATPAGSEFQYRVRVKYVGDVGAQSGEIKVTFPIPDDVRVLTDAELNAIGAETKLVQAGSVKETEGANSGDFMGGRVVEAKYDPATETLTATIDGLFTGTEVEISIWCENETKIFPQGGGYVYWDGTATAQDSAALVSSNIYRLWDQRGAGENPPSKTEYTLTYEFDGDLPPDAADLLPAQKSYTSGAQATVAAAPQSLYDYYEFVGWTDESGKSYKAGDRLTMNKNITLTGTWKLNESAAPTITVNYAYSGNVPTGAPVIGADGQIQPSQQITVGKTHTVVANLTDVDYSSFNG